MAFIESIVLGGYSHVICNLQNLLLGPFLLYKVAVLRMMFACGDNKSRPLTMNVVIVSQGHMEPKL